MLKRLFSGGYVSILAAVLFFAAVLAIIVSALGNAAEASDAEQLKTAESAVRRAAVTCYALEGSYPPSYDYIKENYGISVDEDKFIVHYDIFASNIMPYIMITEAVG